MIGVFDSGRGGIFTVREILTRIPHIDIAYLADRENAPYGNKSTSELIPLVINDIKRLVELGADKILIACCTASTVYHALPKEYQKISVPIIEYTARRAIEYNGVRIGVAATEATVRSGAFRRALASDNRSVFSLAMPNLAGKIDRLENTEDSVREMAAFFASRECDTIVLGCTHFSAVRRRLSELLPNVNIVDSALAAAELIVNQTENKGTGKILYM